MTRKLLGGFRLYSTITGSGGWASVCFTSMVATAFIALSLVESGWIDLSPWNPGKSRSVLRDGLLLMMSIEQT